MSNQTQPATLNDIAKFFPNCIVPCFDTQQSGDCLDYNTACLCRNIYWLTGTLVCVGQTCNSSDVVKFQVIYPQWCNLAYKLEAAWLADVQENSTAHSSSSEVNSLKPESLAGISVGSIAGGFLVLLLIVYVLWRRLRGSALQQSRSNWEVDLTKFKDNDSELEEQAVSSSPYPAYLSDRLPIPPIPPESGQCTQNLSGKRAELMSMSNDNDQRLNEARPSQTLAIPVSPVPSQVPPPSYHGESPEPPPVSQKTVLSGM